MDRSVRRKFVNVPNVITSVRIVLVPVFVVLLVFVDTTAAHEGLNRDLSLAAALFFAFMMLSDMVDGFIARRYHLTSTFGKFIDPLADKLMYITSMIMMIPLGRIPAWIVAVFFMREVTVTALRGIAVDEGIVIDASKWGKYKSAVVSSATIGLLLHYSFWGVEWRLLGWFFLVPALVLAVASGVDYCVGFVRAMRGRAAS